MERVVVGDRERHRCVTDHLSSGCPEWTCRASTNDDQWTRPLALLLLCVREVGLPPTYSVNLHTDPPVIKRMSTLILEEPARTHNDSHNSRTHARNNPKREKRQNALAFTGYRSPATRCPSGQREKRQNAVAFTGYHSPATGCPSGQREKRQNALAFTPN